VTVLTLSTRRTKTGPRPYADGKPRYEVRVRRPGGREVSKTFRTKVEAQRWEREFLTRRDKGDTIDPGAGRVLLAEYVPTWLDGRRISARTRYEYEGLLRRSIVPAFGARRLASITGEDVAAWHVKLAGEKPAEAARAFRVLSSILRSAVRAGRIVRNPCDQVAGGGVERAAERPIIEPGQIVALAAAMPERLSTLILLAGFGGLRRGELLGLQRRHYDPLHRRLHVEQAVSLFGGERLTVAPKQGSARVMELPEELADAVEEHLARWVEADADAPMFTGELGRPIVTRSLYAAFDVARVEVGLPGVHLHDLRHAAGTLRAQLGGTLREVMAELGHRTPAAALRYQHAADRRRREMADLVGGAMRSASATKPTRLDARGGRGARAETAQEPVSPSGENRL